VVTVVEVEVEVEVIPYNSALKIIGE